MHYLLAQLNAKPIEELERMTEVELLEYFKSVLSLTRPEQVIIKTKQVAEKAAAPKTVEDVLSRLPPELQAKLKAIQNEKAAK